MNTIFITRVFADLPTHAPIFGEQAIRNAHTRLGKLSTRIATAANCGYSESELPFNRLADTDIRFVFCRGSNVDPRQFKVRM